MHCDFYYANYTTVECERPDHLSLVWVTTADDDDDGGDGGDGGDSGDGNADGDVVSLCMNR